MVAPCIRQTTWSAGALPVPASVSERLPVGHSALRSHLHPLASVDAASRRLRLCRFQRLDYGCHRAGGRLGGLPHSGAANRRDHTGANRILSDARAVHVT